MVNNTNRDFVVNCKRAGIVSSDRLSVHCLRKSYGTNLADLGTPVHTLKSLMGHSNIQTTMKFYIKNNDENSMKAVRGLEGLMVEQGYKSAFLLKKATIKYLLDKTGSSVVEFMGYIGEATGREGPINSY